MARFKLPLRSGTPPEPSLTEQIKQVLRKEYSYTDAEINRAFAGFRLINSIGARLVEQRKASKE